MQKRTYCYDEYSYLIRTFLFVLVLIGQIPLNASANTIQNLAADELFSQFDSDQLTGSLYVGEKLLELKALIATDDVARLQKLKTLTCPRIPSNDIDKLQAFADEYSDIEQQTFYAPSTPILLSLCRSRALMYLGELQQANHINQQALSDAQTLKDAKLIADAYFAIGQLSLFENQFLSAIDSMSLSFELYQTLGYLNAANINIISLASAYRRLGDNKKAIYYYRIVEKYFTENNQPNLLAIIEQSMAYIKLDNGEYQESLDYFEKIYAVALKGNRPVYVAEMAVDMSAPLIKLNR